MLMAGERGLVVKEMGDVGVIGRARDYSIYRDLSMVFEKVEYMAMHRVYIHTVRTLSPSFHMGRGDKSNEDSVHLGRTGHDTETSFFVGHQGTLQY